MKHKGIFPISFLFCMLAIFASPVIEADITLVRRWNEVEQLPYASDHLKEKDDEDTTPEDIGIAGPPRHLFFKAPANDSVERPTVIDPMDYFCEHR